MSITLPLISSTDGRSLRYLIEQYREEETKPQENRRKKMCQIQLTRTIDEKWMKNPQKYLQEAQELMEESTSEEYDYHIDVRESLYFKGQFIEQICTSTHRFEQESFVEENAQYYYEWQTIINTYNYYKDQQNIPNTCKLHKKINHAMQNITTLPTSEGTFFAVVKTYQYSLKKKSQNKNL
ncbi:MAG: hypothetical protein Q8Q60_04455 [Candidatus Chromulinivorax sp.]|nr:hypothetical protein [Candidatus Chromulinivorax sp.]